MLLLDCDVCSCFCVLGVPDESTAKSTVEHIRDVVVGVSGGYATEWESACGRHFPFALYPSPDLGSHTPDWNTLASCLNQSSAQLAVGITSSSPTPSTTPSPTLTVQPTYTPKPTNPPYAPIAVCSVIALGLLLGMAAWFYRRRNRVAPASRPPPDFEIDGAGLPTHSQSPHLAHFAYSSSLDHPRPASWTWWKSLGRSQTRHPTSDPSKIDAWRYPFDYEPVSTGPSSGSSSQRYDDPFRPRRNSAVDSVGVRGQHSSGTLGQRYSSTQNLVHGRATPSPVPNSGSTPVQTYPALPPGINVNHTSSFVYGSPQPPTYGQTIPYTYPYTQPTPAFQNYQPVPSSSTASPRSPHHARQPRRSADQMVMIPIEQMSPVQIEQLRLQFPDLRIKRKRRRRRDEPETDREDRGQVGTEASRRRPRSMSVPAVVQVEDQGPRNAVELREKYEHRRRSRSGGGEGIMTITTRRASVVVQGGQVVLRQGSADGRRESGSEDRRRPSGDGRRESWEDGRSRVRGPRERERGRAQDGGVSLMGGPPRRA
ncbi:unnamed protein product [Rhizoctonia solani]|uniref:Transmembrane protein n=1 Tax=Rhizoctonia solani TaxID=456999 RepID=A0A8H2XU52_9AGAM|nr:unnamed protein product [Rhizoctonia solani]